MKTPWTIVVAAAAAVALPVSAEEAGIAATPSAAGAVNSRALEFGFAVGYSQGTGDIARFGPTLGNYSKEGAGIELDMGYRFSPHLLIGLYGTGSRLTVQSGAADVDHVWSASAGVQADWHFQPDRKVDPWVGLGSGWRGHWVVRGEGTESRHGLEFARAQAGVDLRVSREFTVSPVASLSANLFLTEKGARQSSYSDVSDPRVNFFLFGGVMGRFDVAIQ